MNSTEILSRLIGFDTTSRNPNMDLISFLADLLKSHGIESALIRNEDGTKANLYATIGPQDKSGVMLSGHTDVVPVDGQNWTKPPFELTNADGRYYGRGAADMKGFVACAVAAGLNAVKRDLKVPLHLAFSYDEEIGCIGVRSLIDMLEAAPHRPAMCIVGEPTNLAVATGHKGKVGMRATCTGREGHSALAPLALNALHLGCDFVQALREIQENLRLNGKRDADYDVPYSTVHVGRMNGGVALNIVPNLCEIDFEIRNIAEDDPEQIFSVIKAHADAIAKAAQEQFEEANIEIEIFNTYPGLSTPTDAEVVEFVKSLTGANGTMKVAFGTEGGLFSQRLDVPTVVCGPGSMAQGHKPDEYVEIEQIVRCDAMLERLLTQLETGD